MAIFSAQEFISKAKSVATDYKTLYVMGCFGAPMNDSNKARYTTNCAYNRRADRAAKINAASADTFGFDCVCLIKGLLWGWNGDVNAVYGGASYCSNGVPDFTTEGMLSYCTEVSTDFNNIPDGAVLWIQGHVGIYIGDGLAVECTPSWEDKVQITAVANIKRKNGYGARLWSKWGKLTWIDYADSPDVISVDGSWGQATTRYTQMMLGTDVDGIVSNQPYSNKKYLANASTSSWEFKLFGYRGGSNMVRALQQLIGAEADGYFGRSSVMALQSFLNAHGESLDVDGSMGGLTVAAWQRYINAYFK